MAAVAPPLAGSRPRCAEAPPRRPPSSPRRSSASHAGVLAVPSSLTCWRAHGHARGRDLPADSGHGQRLLPVAGGGRGYRQEILLAGAGVPSHYCPLPSVPKIDFAGIHPAEAGGGDEARWAAVRSAVMDALRTHGCFEAVTDGLISPELRAAVLGAGGALEALHSLPVSTKERSTNNMPHRGYLSLPGLAYESSVIMEPLSLDSVRAFADLMWPEPNTGNAAFCESIHAYVEKVEVLVSVVRRMVLESVGATAEYIENLAKMTSFKLRLTAYAPPGTAEGRLGAYAHRDTSYLTVLSQNDIDGIEMEDGRGEAGWTRLPLSPGSFLVLAGEMLRALTNDQVFSPLHRVVVAGDKTRYSAILFAAPRDDFVVEAVDKAVDADHPAIFRPFKYGEYYVFCYNRGGDKRFPDNLDDFALRRSD